MAEAAWLGPAELPLVLGGRMPSLMTHAARAQGAQGTFGKGLFWADRETPRQPTVQGSDGGLPFGTGRMWPPQAGP